MIDSSVIQELIDKNGTEPDEAEISRRSFLGLGIAAIGTVYVGAIGYPIYKYLATPAERAEASAAVTQTILDGADKLPVNSAMMFKFGTKPAMLIRFSDQEFVALNAVCTHLGCTVKYNEASGRIECACHGGVYDPKTGANVSGPPPKPLTRYNVEVQDGRVTVTRT